MMMCIQNVVSFCQFVLKILDENQNLTSIKGRNPVANLKKTKTMIYITNVDLVNDNEYTKFGQFVLKILSKNEVLMLIKGRNSVANLRKQRFTILMVILSKIQNLVLICQFVLKILSKNQILNSIKGHNSVANLRKTIIYILT